VTEELPREVARDMLTHIVATEPEIARARNVLDAIEAYEEQGVRQGRLCACGCALPLPKGRPQMKYASERCRMRAAGRRRKGRPGKRLPPEGRVGNIAPSTQDEFERMRQAITRRPSEA
jgi:hypothetical protein